MAGGKQTPRQKLIGLMYLIFLSLMALNVSVEVLDSFPLIDRSIQETNRNFEAKVESVYYDFEEQRANFSDEHVHPFHGEALYVGELADSLVNYILTKRTMMLMELNNIDDFEEADTMDLDDSRRKDNYSISSRFWLVEGSTDPGARDGGPGTRAYILKEKISHFKSEIDSILAIHDQELKMALDVEGPFRVRDRSVTWQEFTFDRVISVAVATNLSRLVTEVRNVHFDAINMLYDLITAGQFRFDDVTAAIVPRSEIVMTGSHYEADIFVAAIDTRQDPEITVQGVGSIPVQDGVGRLRIPATQPGTRTIRGTIEVISPAGVRVPHTFETEYTVERPMATVSATGMNLFYIGLDNPVSISAPGVPSENLRPEISAGATMTRQPDGNYIVNVEPEVRDVTITVNAMVEGRVETMERMDFRALPLPSPEPVIGGLSGGRIDRQVLVRAGVLEASMGEGFAFDLSYDIASFDLITVRAGEQRQERQQDGAELTPDMINYINDARSGQVITFANIMTRPGPDGEPRNLGSMSFTIR